MLDNCINQEPRRNKKNPESWNSGLFFSQNCERILMSVARIKIQEFAYCEDCNQYEPFSNCVADSVGNACTCCACNKVPTGNQDWTGRAI